MKTEVYIASGAIFVVTTIVLIAAIRYYYKCKELHRQAVQRHRAANTDEKRALVYWDKARENRTAAHDFYAQAYRLREEANQLVEQAISLVKEHI